MRVLYLTNAAQIGGGNRSLLVLWQAIRRLDVEPFAVCPDDGPMVAESRRQSIPVEIRPYVQPAVRSPRATLRATRDWIGLLRRERIDLVHANDPSNARAIAMAARVVGVPVVCYVHYPPASGYLEWCFRFLPSPRAFAYCSDAIRREIEPAARAVAPGSLHRVIHNSVALADFPAPAPDTRRTGPLRIGIIANLLPVKGHDDFLTMASILTRNGVDAEFVIVGGDIHGSGYGETLHDLAKSLGIADRVHFTGHVPNVPDILRTLDIVVCASTVEPFGICVIEAMAAGKPVVATRTGGLPEIVLPERTGLLVEPRNPAQLADAVGRLATAPELRAVFGTAGRQRVEEAFSDARQAEDTAALYREVLERARRRA